MTRHSRGLLMCASTLVLATSSFVAPSAGAQNEPKATLTMRLTVRDDRGQVGCALFNSAKGFPTDSSAAVQRKWCAIEKTESACQFEPVPAGTYAVACFHDENKNGKLDENLLGIPSEGSVASNNAKGSMGPPSYEDAKFSLAAKPTVLRLTMNY